MRFSPINGEKRARSYKSSILRRAESAAGQVCDGPILRQARRDNVAGYAFFSPGASFFAAGSLVAAGPSATGVVLPSAVGAAAFYCSSRRVRPSSRRERAMKVSSSRASKVGWGLPSA